LHTTKGARLERQVEAETLWPKLSQQADWAAVSSNFHRGGGTSLGAGLSTA